MIKSNFGEFIEDGLRDEVTPMNNSECKDCNECCSMGTMLTDEEYETLKRFLKKDKLGKYLYQLGKTTILRHLKNGVVYWMCPFSLNKRCQIYKNRPQICKNFHCDDPVKSKEFRDTYDKGNSHTILELFQDETFKKHKIKRRLT